MMRRILASTVLMTCFLAPPVTSRALTLPPEKSSEEIRQDNDMSLSHEGKSGVSLSLDTTDPEMLKLGVELQTALFHLSGARLPMVDSQHAGGKWNSIVLQRKFPSSLYVANPLPYEVEITKHEPWYVGCSKNLEIRFEKGHEKEAVDAFLSSAFGVTLATASVQMQGREPVRDLYVPGDFGPLPEPLAESRKQQREQMLKHLKDQATDRSLDVRTRYLAVLKLGQEMDASAVAMLVEICEGDEKPIMKQYALRAIGYIRDPKAIPCLVGILSRDVTGDVAKDEDDECILRRGALSALGQMRDLPEPVLHLLMKLETSDKEYPSVKESADGILRRSKREGNAQNQVPEDTARKLAAPQR